MTAKPTPSRDGKYRIDMRITFRAGIDELAALLAATQGSYTHGDDLPEWTTGETREAIRRRLYDHGYSLDGWSDDLDTEERAEVLEWATNLVRRAYPELAACRG